MALKAGVHGLLGPNGAGKTTLMRALSTVVKPAGGSLTLLGAQVDG
ncbi:ATP-binding cassette domain-containing protein [Streptomyces sp. NPDC003328]